MTNERKESAMNAAQLVREADRVSRLLVLTRNIRAMVSKSENGRLALILLASQERQLLGLRRRLMEAALVELLWQYRVYVEGTDTGYVVRQLIVDIGAKQ
jgi:hypothetical protein